MKTMKRLEFTFFIFSINLIWKVSWINILAVLKQKPVDDLYSDLQDYCVIQGEVDFALGAAERLGLLDPTAMVNENEIEGEGEDDDEHPTSPNNCYGPNERGRGHRKRSSLCGHSSSGSRRKRPPPSGGSRSGSQKKQTPKRKSLRI
uniref:Uncharacterized protein n=1 Tax=Glossina brevipalpis TaxID=37001 RepID=A0A1A9WMF9_9MUSC